MQWLTRYRLIDYNRRSVWLVPTAVIPLAGLAARLVRAIDEHTTWRGLAYSPDGARAVLSAITPATLTFLVLILSMLLLAVQLASSQLSPRLIGRILARGPIKACLAIFVFSHIYSAAALGRITNDRVPQLSVVVAITLTMISVGAGLFLVDYLGRELRPVQMLARTANVGRAVIEHVYPTFLPTGASDCVTTPPAHRPALPSPFDTIARRGRSGVFLAMDIEGLAAIARKAGCAIEIIPEVGDFVARGEALFRIHPSVAGISHAALNHSLALGDERTAEQDPTFVFRILVDVAAKALSPAINDPTTAVLAIDQIHHLLRQVGMRRLGTGEVRDSDGTLRVLYRTPDWEDFVLLSITEIRQYGNTSIQVTRRLAAMLENLIALLPAERADFLREQSRLLQSSIERYFADPADQECARISDRQGVGGSSNGDET